MGRQLRYFNDVGSIMNWANAMVLVKSLLLEIQPEPQSSTNPQPQSPSIFRSQHRFPVNYPHISSTKTSRSTLVSRSITPPTTICYKPATEKPFTRSPPRCSSYTPLKPSPLSTYTLCLPTINPDDSLPQYPKRRKIAIPPSVDYHASIEIPQPTSTATTALPPHTLPGQGKKIWYISNPKGPVFHLWSQIKHKGAEEYIVIKAPPDWNSPFRLKNVATGEYCDLMFCKENEHLFHT